MPYYYVRILDEADKTKTIALRCEKAKGPIEACKLAFGVVYNHDLDHQRAVVHYKMIGNRSPAYLSAKRKKELQSQSEGWLLIPKHGP